MPDVAVCVRSQRLQSVRRGSGGTPGGVEDSRTREPPTPYRPNTLRRPSSTHNKKVHVMAFWGDHYVLYWISPMDAPRRELSAGILHATRTADARAPHNFLSYYGYGMQRPSKLLACHAEPEVLLARSHSRSRYALSLMVPGSHLTPWHFTPQVTALPVPLEYTQAAIRSSCSASRRPPRFVQDPARCLLLGLFVFSSAQRARFGSAMPHGQSVQPVS